MCQQFGLYFASYPPAVALGSLSKNELMDLGSLGLSHLIEEAGNFRRLIEKGARESDRLSLDSTYGPLAQFYQRSVRKGQFTAFAEVFAGHRDQVLLARTGGLSRRGTDRQASGITVRSLAEAHGVSISTLLDLLIELEPTQSALFSPESVVSETLAQVMRMRIGRLGTAADLDRLLGLSRKITNKLIDSGFCKRAGQSGPYSTPLFDLEEPRAFLKEMTEGVRVYSKAPSGLASLTTRKSQGTLALVQALKDGRLSCEGRLRDVVGLPSLLVDAQQVRETVPIYEDGDQTPVVNGAGMLSICEETAARLVADGLLRTVPYSRKSRKRRLLTRESVERFGACYISKLALAAQFGLDPKAVTRRLNACGVSGIQVNGNRYLGVFERPAALAALEGDRN